MQNLTGTRTTSKKGPRLAARAGRLQEGALSGHLERDRHVVRRERDAPAS